MMAQRPSPQHLEKSEQTHKYFAIFFHYCFSQILRIFSSHSQEKSQVLDTWDISRVSVNGTEVRKT